MDLAAYLARIGYDAMPRPDAETLIRIHRAHREAIPYENLDVQFGRPLTVDPAAAFDKIVHRGRGGWCYEMNGTLGLALQAIGFRVERLAGAVFRPLRGDANIGSHLVLLVHLDEPWFADVGFGAGGPHDPAPLREGPISSDFRKLRLERVEGGWWRYWATPESGPPNFDFHPERGDPDLLSAVCARLQTDPNSVFINNAIVMRADPHRVVMLRDRSFGAIDKDGLTTREIASPSEYLTVLKQEFRLDLPEAGNLWGRFDERPPPPPVSPPPQA